MLIGRRTSESANSSDGQTARCVTAIFVIEVIRDLQPIVGSL